MVDGTEAQLIRTQLSARVHGNAKQLRLCRNEHQPKLTRLHVVELQKLSFFGSDAPGTNKKLC